MKKQILILDDLEIRHGSIESRMREDFGDECEFHHVWTAEEAIDLMMDKEFDLASLDHDLGSGHSGMTVVDHICRNTVKTPKVIHIHSANFIAGKNMLLKLIDAGIESYFYPAI